MTRLTEAELREVLSTHEIISDTGNVDMQQTPDHKQMVGKARSTKVTIDGHVFDSKAEGRRYVELLAEQRKGEIRNLELQPKFVLQPGFTTPALDEEKGPQKHRPITYTADFRYDSGGDWVVEDVKGMTAPLTQQFILRWKIAQYQNQGVTFVIVRR